VAENWKIHYLESVRSSYLKATTIRDQDLLRMRDLFLETLHSIQLQQPTPLLQLQIQTRAFAEQLELVVLKHLRGSLTL
jgi:hypothetical protein